jgi:hypothetical protein
MDGYAEAQAHAWDVGQPVISDPQLPANLHDLPKCSNHVGTIRGHFETIPVGPDCVSAAETWPLAIPDFLM